eukprot:Blabericola_migrator_1__3241@NODE_1954_length_3512_cov_307_726560_g262_i1_p3_GENE_NODE_1954_length_3512_cov_307_726560_g262_i1NODE_1954_length_3512_cov_307_726560_g262_i1_p3_ORF_typecomplete_len214_score4_24_NODE_1954_length_3512_cov_307_726560_g262_i18701511
MTGRTGDRTTGRTKAPRVHTIGRKQVHSEEDRTTLVGHTRIRGAGGIGTVRAAYPMAIIGGQGVTCGVTVLLVIVPNTSHHLHRHSMVLHSPTEGVRIVRPQSGGNLGEKFHLHHHLKKICVRTALRSHVRVVILKTNSHAETQLKLLFKAQVPAKVSRRPNLRPLLKLGRHNLPHKSRRLAEVNCFTHPLQIPIHGAIPYDTNCICHFSLDT